MLQVAYQCQTQLRLGCRDRALLLLLPPPSLSALPLLMPQNPAPMRLLLQLLPLCRALQYSRQVASPNASLMRPTSRPCPAPTGRRATPRRGIQARRVWRATASPVEAR